MGNVYSNTKVFHFREKIESLAQSSEILGPIHIRIKPTNACNHNCSYCAYRTKVLQLGKNMNKTDYIPKEKMLEIIQDLGNMKVKAITFSGGGEPFLYKYLTNAVESIINKNIDFAALTNGSYLSGYSAELFAEYSHWIRISMDGWDNESYARYRGVSRSEFTNVLKNIKCFSKKKKKSILGVNIIVEENNYSNIYKLIGKLKENGVNTIKLSGVVVDNDLTKNNRYHINFYKKAKEVILNAKVKYESDNFEIYDSYHLLSDNFEKNYKWCPYIQILPIIGADLNVYSCQDKAYNLNNGLIGSIKEQSFYTFWYNDKSKFFSINPIKDCKHHCIANTKNKMIIDYIEAEKDHLNFV